MKKVGDYFIKEKIGEGAFSEVYTAIKKNTSGIFAVKVMNKDKISEAVRSYIPREISILKKINNDHVVQLLDVKVSEHNFYLIFEYCNGGDLKDYRKVKGGYLKEQTTRSILRQVIDGITSLYKLGGIHRDIKLGNILLHYPTMASRVSDTPLVKMCDFGFARMLEQEKLIRMSEVGTPFNMSPEMTGCLPYGIESDIWSLGVVAYELLCGEPPFNCLSKDELKNLVLKGDYRIQKRFHLSVEAIDFLTSCLQYNAENRLKWQDLKDHPFIYSNTETPLDLAKLKEENKDGMEEDLKFYTITSKAQYSFINQYSFENQYNKEPFIDLLPEQRKEFQWVENEYVAINRGMLIDTSEYILI